MNQRIVKTLVVALIPALLASHLLAQRPVLRTQSIFPTKVRASSPDAPGLLQSPPVNAANMAAPPVLTLANTEELALQHNPSLAHAAARVEAAWGELVQSGLYPNTVIGYHGTMIGNQGGPGEQGGFIQQQFITGGKLRLNQSLANHDMEIAEVELTIQEQRVLNDVRSRFYEVLVAQQRVTLTDELLRIAKTLVQSTETLLQAGRVNENHLLQAQLEFDNAHILRDNATNLHRESWQRLRSIIGNLEIPMQSVEGHLGAKAQVFTWEESLRSILNDHPELTHAAIDLERSRVALQRACRERYPNIDVMVSVRHGHLTAEDLSNIKVGFPLPLFDRNQGNIFKAQAELVAAQNRVRQTELRLRDQLAITFRRYANARQQVERYQEHMMPRAQRSLDFVNRGYREGQVDFLTLLTSQRTYYQVNLQYLDALNNLRTSEIMMNGHLLEGSFQLRAPHHR